MDLHLADLFEGVVDAVPGRVALVCGDRRVAYRELDERANRLAHHLQAVGVGAGQHVGVYQRNGVAYAETCLAAYKIRAVPINVNWRYAPGELAYLFDDADLVAVVAQREFVPHLAETLAFVPPLHVVLVDDSSGAEVTVAGVDYEAALDAQPATRGFEPRSGDDVHVMYTGGTTGLPKGVMWRHRDLFTATDSLSPKRIARPEDIGPRAAASPDGSEVLLATTPLMHASAERRMMSMFLLGARVVLLQGRTFDPDEVWRLVERERVTRLLIVGDAIGRPLVDALAANAGRYETSSLEFLGAGGAITSPSVKAGLLELLPAVTLTDSFGSTESFWTGSAIATAATGPGDGLQFTRNAWTSILDENLREVEPGSGVVGRIATRGPMCLGYYKDPERSAALFADVDGERWLLEGDMATLDADGSTVRFHGRGSMCINTGGEKVYPEEVELALKAHPAVDDALVVGIPDERWGQLVAAVVGCADGVSVDTEDLASFVRQRIAAYKTPRQITFVTHVARFPTGKGDYAWARAELASIPSASQLKGHR